MEGERGRIRLVLRSKRVARVAEFSAGGASPGSLMAWNGPLSPSQKRKVMVYDYVFDERQKRTLYEARDLAERTGMILEVTDLSRQNPLRRALRIGASRVGTAIGRAPLQPRASVGPMVACDDQRARQEACPL